MKHQILYLLLFLMVSCVSNEPAMMGDSDQDQSAYDETYRPQYHFSPPSQWMNDPNGMVYYAGEYHLFYQYYPDSTVWGPMHWGHAVSEDLVHWQHLPIALYPDENGYIFSGSAVVDWKNTSDFGSSENPPLVAIYTYHDPLGAENGSIDFQTQGIAYSLDSGRNWTKYNKNPVLENPGIKDFRDPKVFYSETHQKWVMVLAVKDHISFYSSENLKDWVFESDFGSTIGAHGGVWECPDLFPLIDNDGNIHWVLLVSINPGGPAGGSATQYFVGDFDGQNFIPLDTITRWLDYGADNYAGVTWSDITREDGRRIFIGWMSNWNYAQVVPTIPWRSAMTIPRTISIITDKENIFLKSEPVRELDRLVRSSEEIDDFRLEQNATNALFRVSLDLSNSITGVLRISNTEGEEVTVEITNDEIYFDRTNSGETSFDKSFSSVHRAPLLMGNINNLSAYVDMSSIELFLNDGEITLSELVFPHAPYTRIKFEPTNKDSPIPGKIEYFDSIWQDGSINPKEK